MVARSSVARRRQLAQLGQHIRTWRQLQGLSASELAVIAALGFAEHFVTGPTR